MQSIITWQNLFNMEQLLQSADFLCIVNQHRRNKGYTAELSNLPTVYTEDSSDAIFPDFVNAYPKTHQRIMARYVDAVSSA